MMGWLEAILIIGAVTLEALRAQTDEELVSRAREQDDEGKRAFEVLVERHQGWLLRMLTNLVKSREDAEELVQNAFVSAFFALPRFRGDSSFKTWMRTIATREAFSHYRKHGDRAERASEIIEETMPDESVAGQERLAQREALERALMRVPYPYREILVLRYVEQLSLAEIGETLELGKSATKMRLKRARDYFKEAYGGVVA